MIQAKNNYGSTALTTLDVVNVNTVKSAEVLNAKQVKVTFNTPVEKTTAETKSYYSLKDTTPSDAELVSDTECVLTFMNAISNIADDTERELKITGDSIITKADKNKKIADYKVTLKTLMLTQLLPLLTYGFLQT